MSNPSDRLINLFGALALGVADRVRAAALEETALGGETIAALVVIGHAPRLSIDQLGKILKLSHAGSVRLVDRLVGAGFAMRGTASHDKRVIALELTTDGQDRRRLILARRRDALALVLAGLSSSEQEALEDTATVLLGRLAHDPTSALSVCRLCNERQCDDCPMNAFGAIEVSRA